MGIQRFKFWRISNQLSQYKAALICDLALADIQEPNPFSLNKIDAKTLQHFITDLIAF